MLPDGRRRAAARHQRRRRRSSGWRRRPVPRARRPGPPAWRRSAPRTRTSGSSGSTRSPGHVVLQRSVGDAAPAAAGARSTTWPRAGTWSTRRFPDGTVGLARNPDFDADRGHGRATSRYVQPPVWSDVDLAHRARAPSGTGSRRPATTRTRYVCERRTFAGAGRDRRCRSPASGTGTPRSTAPRRALVYGYGAYEYTYRARRGTRRCPACSTGASSSSTPTSAAAARAAGAGGSTAGWSTSSTRSPTTSRSPTGSRRRPASTATGSRPAGCQRRRAAPGRGVQPAARTAGAAVVAEVPFVDVVTTMFDAVDPADRHRVGRVGRPAPAGRSSTGCSPTRRTTTCRRAGSRPDLLVTGALHDPRVMVSRAGQVGGRAARRPTRTWSPRCLFRVRDRCRRPRRARRGGSAHLAYEAEVYAWVLDRLAVTDAPSQ